MAKFYSPSLKAQILEYAGQHGITEAANKFGVTRFAIYDWQRKVKLQAEGNAKDSPLSGNDEVPKLDRDQRILAERDDGDWQVLRSLPGQITRGLSLVRVR